MLVSGWKWFLYGEKEVYGMIWLIFILVLCALSITLLKPAYMEWAIEVTLYQKKKHALEQQMQWLRNNDFSSVVPPDPIPWLELANEYELFVKRQGENLYLSGSSKATVALLLYVLRHHGKLVKFQIKKNNYKTVLVIVDAEYSQR